MKYLEIENGKCEGWTFPMYYGDALEFANEVKENCMAGKSGTAIHDGEKLTRLHFTTYRFKDGTQFILTYDDEEELIEIEARDIYDDDFSTVYYNRKY